nr:hypothetical protein [Butyrivibrio sp.]
FAKSNKNCTLEIGFYSKDGECFGESSVSLEAGSDYKKYDCVISSGATRDNVVLRIKSYIESNIIIGFTSLMPQKTFKGHGLREDLVVALKNTNSKFIRFPGGCVVEGLNEENALIFSRTIGPVWERPSCYLMWHYRTTNGLGYHEYLQLCEDLEMDAMYVCNCGMSCQARHGHGFDDEITSVYLQEALNAIEYALGDESTKYGQMRALNGHPEPFPLAYLEIGNENFGPEYSERYKMFYKVIHEKYPALKLIANSHVEREGLDAQIVDEHYYNTPEYFIENKHLFDEYDRKGPEIFIGEYAVNGGNTIASLECALAEAVFLTGVEKNQDIVKLSAYAPLFQNSDYTAWLPNLIVFDQSRVYGIPSYHAISLMGRYRGNKVVASEAIGDSVPPKYFGIPGIMCEKEGLYFKNPMINGKIVDVSKEIYGEAVNEDGIYKLINGNARHRFTGKNEEWNLEFEKFIGAGPEVDNPVLWAAFGDEDLEELTYEIDLKIDKDNPVTLSIWNYYPNTDVGCNEPRDDGWNLRSVRNQIWKLENGRSMLRAPRFFDPPLKDDEVKDISIDYDSFNHFKIVAKPGKYSCYLNDCLIQEKVLPLLPLISEVTTVDDEHVYVKLVNVGGGENEVSINLDCEVEENYSIAYIKGRPEDVNSFENPEKISVKTENRTGADRSFKVMIPANSINVIILKLQK